MPVRVSRLLAWCGNFLTTEDRENESYLLFLSSAARVLSLLELSLGCDYAFQYLPCFADTWVPVLLQPLLYCCCIGVEIKAPQSACSVA